MKKSLALIGIISWLLVIAGCSNNTEPIPLPAVEERPDLTGSGAQEIDEDIITTETTASQIFTVEMSDSGFSSSSLTVNKGDTVKFVAKGSGSYWPASAIHPTHDVYPEAGGCIGSKFDACKGLTDGEEFSFTFNEAGEWKYHDHLNPSKFGTITVQ
ncbi:MAG: cupredoxin domain-containing protein [Candidatus Woesearchaeota archaeon]|nr:MAG: cupredoxin domain-containing protein [Candidatus Woesearchaeota archaeon]